MLINLKNKYFIGSRGFYGTNSVKFHNIEIEVTKYNHDYANPVTNFDWGKNDRATTLLAYAILDIIATPTIARVYAKRYTQDVLSKIFSDEWKISAIEVAQWINANTDYTITLNQEHQKKVQETAEEQVSKNRDIQTNIVETIIEELGVKYETLAKILELPLETINQWKLENEMPKMARKAIEFYKAGSSFKEQSFKRKTEISNLQEDLSKCEEEKLLMQKDLTKYRKIINALDIPNLYKSYKEL
jgi:DNA-binding transcriptional regulator YiaG